MQLLLLQVQLTFNLAQHLIIYMPSITHADHGPTLRREHFLPEAGSSGRPIQILCIFTPIETCAIAPSWLSAVYQQ